MNKIVFDNAALGIQVDWKQFDTLQNSIINLSEAKIKAFIQDSYNTNELWVLYGCDTAVNGSDYTVSKGAMYYNGEIYLVDAHSVNSGATPNWAIKTTTEAGNFGDGNSYVLRREKKIVLQSASGIKQYGNEIGFQIDASLIKNESIDDKHLTTARVKCPGNQLLIKKIDIGDWNMDTTDTLSINHGLDYTKIISYDIIIRNDNDSVREHLEGFNGTGNEKGISSISETIIFLGRANGGVFDNTSHNSTSYNRGWVIITYEA